MAVGQATRKVAVMNKSGLAEREIFDASVESVVQVVGVDEEKKYCVEQEKEIGEPLQGGTVSSSWPIQQQVGSKASSAVGSRH